MNKPKLVRSSLTQHFTPDAGFVGEFGWICGYSADAKFMDMAVERFTGQIAARRSAAGCIRLGLLLDSGNAQVTTAEAPGIMHFPANAAELPFRLLHAKVAVLGFRNLDEPERFQLRLLVSTGNWTRATLEDNLDLIWRIDIDSEDLVTDDAELGRRCADLNAAWGLMTWLRGLFNTRLLDAAPAHLGDTETTLAHARLEQWVAEVSQHAHGRSRFIDNRNYSLFANVRRKLRNEGNGAARNYLAMGSGFYEGGTRKGLPVVLETIIAGFQDDGVLTHRTTVDLFVNATGCQAIAHAIDAINDAKWKVRPPASFNNALRFMHAKFLFSARHMATSNRCSSAWMYLGSGNLTNPGFLSKASRHEGNLEAGVVQSFTDLYWYDEDGVEAEALISNLLPIQWKDAFSPNAQLAHGDEMAPREPQFVAPPLSFLLWQPDAQGGYLVGDTASLASCQIRDPQGYPCQLDVQGRVRWEGARPQQVLMTWQSSGREQQARIPVMDEYGRVAAGALASIGLEEAGWELDGFPLSSDPDDGGDKEPGEDGGDDDPNNLPPSSHPGTQEYPIRQMMKLLEQIAEKQCAIGREDWGLWCHRLEQILTRASDSAVLTVFRKMKLNPLGALYAPAFRPPFAETTATEEGARYEQTLQRIAQAWAVDELARMGAH